MAAKSAATRNKDLLREPEEAYDSGKLDDLASFYNPDFVSHSAVPAPSDPETIKMIHGLSMGAIPDRKVTAEHWGRQRRHDAVPAGRRVAPSMPPA